MSIATEIARISQNITDSLTAVSGKGVTVPTGSNSDDLPGLIAQIQQGSGSAIVITDEQDSHGGTIRHINAVALTGDTVSAGTLLQGYTAHNSLGQAITGTYVPPPAATLGTKSITTNGTYNASSDSLDGYSSVTVTVSSGGTYQAKTNINPSTSSQTITADNGYDALSSVQINAMPSGTAGTPTATKGTVNNHSISVTPSVTNTTGYIVGSTKTGTAVTVSASELVSGTKNISANGTAIDVTDYESVDVNVTPEIVQQPLTVTPSSSIQNFDYLTIGTLIDYGVPITEKTLSLTSNTIYRVNVSLWDSLGNDLLRDYKDFIWTSTEVILSFNNGNNQIATVRIQSNGTIKMTTSGTGIDSGSWQIFEVGKRYTLTTSSSGNHVSLNLTNGIYYHVSYGFAIDYHEPQMYEYEYQAWSTSQNIGLNSNTYITISSSQLSWTDTSNTYDFARVEISSKQADGYFPVTVNAIPNDFVGSSIPRRTSTDLSANGAVVTVPAGYYESQATKSVTTMTLPTSTSASATSGYTSKATVSRSTSDQYINIPPGYNGTGGYYKINAVANMTLPTSTSASATSGYTSKATISRSTSDQYINIPTGYNTAGAYYKISAVANGSATNSGSASGSSATVSTGTNTITLTKSVSITPTVSAGYISSGTAGNVSVALTASVTTKAAATITPTTTNQTIASGTYLTGTQTISGDANLVGSNIISGKSIFGVSGSVVIQHYYTGSGTPSSSLGVNGDIYLKTS